MGRRGVDRRALRPVPGVYGARFARPSPAYSNQLRFSSPVCKCALMLILRPAPQVNHISPKSVEFQDFLAKGDESEYAPMFVDWDKLWPPGMNLPRLGLTPTVIPAHHSAYPTRCAALNSILWVVYAVCSDQERQTFVAGCGDEAPGPEQKARCAATISICCAT